MAELEEITGKVKHVIYYKDSYSVIKIKTDKGMVSVAGNDLPDTTHWNLEYRFYGTMTEHVKYGKTFICTMAEPEVPKDNKDIVGYLSSGLFKGIGKTLAERIYAHFGSDTRKIIEETPERIKEVKGVSEKKAKQLVESVRDNTYLRELVKSLGAYGLTVAHCSKLAKKYGKMTEQAVNDNPYVLVKDLKLSFDEADGIAIKMGISRNDKRRISAGCDNVMGMVLAGGDTGGEVQAFGKRVYAVLHGEVTPKEIEEVIVERIKNKNYRCVKLSVGDVLHQYIFPNCFFEWESYIAKALVRLTRTKMHPVQDIKEKIKASEKRLGVELDETQRNAVETALTETVSVITGAPGTGKTTIEKVIIDVYREERNENVILLAPTGRAARRMTETTGHESSTIHSFLGMYDISDDAEDENFEVVENSLIIADEFSMADVHMAQMLLSRVGEGTQMIIVGDANQLPSVGPGAVLRDIVASETVPAVRLTKIFRSDSDHLYANIHRVNEGITDLESGEDFVMRHVTAANTKQTITDLYKKRVEEYGIENVMLLIPYRKNEGGVDDMNRHLQSVINPAAIGRPEATVHGTTYRAGDPVMHVKCNTPDASNGDIGIVKAVEVNGNDIKVGVYMNEKVLTYNKESLENLDLAYAMTVHKSQGSEAKSVIFCITSAYPAMLYRNIPYVGMSRAKKVIDVLYDEGLQKAIRNYQSNKRLTLLPYFFRYETGKWVNV